MMLEVEQKSLLFMAGYGQHKHQWLNKYAKCRYNLKKNCSPRTAVAQVRFVGPASHVGWVCCWFSRASSEGFSPGSPVFLPPQKPTLQVPIADLHVAVIWLQLLGIPFDFSLLFKFCKSQRGLNNNCTNKHNKQKEWRILVVVVKWCHHANRQFKPEMRFVSFAVNCHSH